MRDSGGDCAPALAPLYIPCVCFVLVGDVMGPGLVQPNLGAWATLQRSSGQGETYVFDFAFDLYWLRYLKASGALIETEVSERLQTMNKGTANGQMDQK